MIDGLCAFPLVPLSGDEIGLAGAAALVRRARDAGVDSLGILGSTGNYAYFDRGERREILSASIEAAEDTPVIVGIGALRTRDVLHLAEDAQVAGASALLLAPVSYQPLTDNEVFELFAEVSADSSVPVIVYDNPATTKFTFSDELHARIARLPRVAGVKIPPPVPDQAAARVKALRQVLPEDYRIGISGDPMAAEALEAGCTSWYSVIAGVFPTRMLELMRTAQSRNFDTTRVMSQQLEPVWEYFRTHGSLRVANAMAEELGLVTHPSLPRPLLGLDESTRVGLRQAMDAAGLHA